MSAHKNRVAVLVLALLLAAMGAVAYACKPVTLYVVAMFGGAYQYDQGFFFTLMGGIVVTTLVLGAFIDHLIFGKKEEKSA